MTSFSDANSSCFQTNPLITYKIWNTYRSACLVSQTTTWHHSSIDNVYLQVIDLNPAERCVLLSRQDIRRFETCLIIVILEPKSLSLLANLYSVRRLCLDCSAPPSLVRFDTLLRYPVPLFRSVRNFWVIPYNRTGILTPTIVEIISLIMYCLRL